MKLVPVQGYKLGVELGKSVTWKFCIMKVEPATKFSSKTAVYSIKNTNNSTTNFSTKRATSLYKKQSQ